MSTKPSWFSKIRTISSAFLCGIRANDPAVLFLSAPEYFILFSAKRKVSVAAKISSSSEKTMDTLESSGLMSDGELA